MSYILGTKHPNLFPRMSIDYIPKNKSSSICPIFSRYFCDSSNYSSKIPWRKKTHIVKVEIVKLKI